MTQTLAIFLDAYRELRARRLFWFVLLITAAVVGAFALVDINEKGLVIAAWEIPLPTNTTVLSRETFYKQLFVNLGVKFWLTYIATVLALISTTGVFPDFLAGGAIELTLSKPISRVRLFLTKYAAGLLFVTLQVLIFSLGAFLIIGFKGGAWIPKLFLAVPIVLAFFSYLFSVCALLGLLTRSAIASLLLTFFAWFIFFGVGSAELIINQVRIVSELDVKAKEAEIAAREVRIAAVKAGEATGGVMSAILAQASLAEQERRLDERHAALDADRASLRTWTNWRRGLYAAKTILPKTSDTIDLLNHSLISPDELTAIVAASTEQRERRNNRRRGADTPDPDTAPTYNFESPEVTAEAIRQASDRSLWWVLGSSLGFEAGVLALACFLFARKDF